jgi:hypothetical protein
VQPSRNEEYTSVDEANIHIFEREFVQFVKDPKSCAQLDTEKNSA